MAYTDEQILAISPIAVIVVMSAGNGKYNFKQTLQQVGQFKDEQFGNQCETFRLSIETLLNDSDYAAEKNPLEIIAVIGRIRKTLQEVCPREADAFCYELIALARFSATNTIHGARTDMTDKEIERERLLRAMLAIDEPKEGGEIFAILGSLGS
jgi:hypothetical protein